MPALEMQKQKEEITRMKGEDERWKEERRRWRWKGQLDATASLPGVETRESRP